MSNQVETLLNYQAIDKELFDAEREFAKNPDNITYKKAVKKVQAVQETLEGYEKRAKILLEKFNSLLSQKTTIAEEKIQLEKTIEESTELVAVEYLKGQIGILASKTDSLKTSLEELEKEIQQINSEYLAYAKEIKEAKEFGKSYKDTYNKLREELMQKKKEVESKLSELEGGISAEILQKYKALRADKQTNFPLVKGCKGGNCSLCGKAFSGVVQNQLSSETVTECEYCHKFIFKLL